MYVTLTQRLTSIFRTVTTPFYAAIAFCVAVCVFAGVVFWENQGVLYVVLTGSYLTFGARLELLYSILSLSGTPHPTFLDVSLLVLAVLAGVNTSVLIKAYNDGELAMSDSLLTLAGTGVGGVAIGCVACSAAVLSGVLAFFGGVGLLALLPFYGRELLLFGFLVLLVSLYFNAGIFTTDDACNFDPE